MDLLHSIYQTIQIRTGTVHQLFRFLVRNKMWWLVPMVLFLVMGFLILILAQSTPVGPFIYTLFQTSMLNLLKTAWKKMALSDFVGKLVFRSVSKKQVNFLFRDLRSKWTRFAVWYGNIMSAIILALFYFTIFSLFALPFKLLSHPLRSQSPESNWIPKKKTISEMEEFKYEF